MSSETAPLTASVKVERPVASTSTLPPSVHVTEEQPGPSESKSTNLLADVVTDTAAESDAVAHSDEPKLSKNALRRARRAEYLAATKMDRRQAEKERKRARHAQAMEDYRSGNLTPEERAEIERKKAAKLLKQQSRARGGMTGIKSLDEGWKGGVIVDLGFDELMTEQEVKSMISQLGYIYNLNRSSSLPFLQILSTSFNGRLADRMVNRLEAQHTRWTRMSFTEAGLDDVIAPAPAAAGAHDSVSSEGQETVTAQDPNPFRGQEFIYLSADSDNELETLSENQTYIIGGIVDRNRYKYLCQNKADQLGIKTARLPIGKYLEKMSTRKVLTVNQVFDILIKYNELQSWQAAFETVVPQRKLSEVTRKEKRKRPANKGEEAGGDEDEDEDEDDEDESAGPEDGTQDVPMSEPVVIQMTAEEEEAMMNEN